MLARTGTARQVLQGLIDANTAQALTPPDYGKAMPVLVAALGDTEKLDMQGLEDDTDSSFESMWK